MSAFQLAVLLLIAASACKEGGDNATAPAQTTNPQPGPSVAANTNPFNPGDGQRAAASFSGFIPLTKIRQPGTVASLDQAKMKGVLNSLTDVFFSKPAGQDCFSQKLASAKLQIQGKEASVEQSIDVKDCSPQQLNQQSLTVNEATLHVKYQLSCLGGDVEFLKDKPLQTINDGLRCVNGQEAAVLANTEYKIRGTISTAQGTGNLVATIAVGTVGADGKGCLVTSESDDWVYNGCLEFQIVETSLTSSVNNFNQSGVDQHVLLEAQQVKVEKTGRTPYFKSGVKKLKLNNWQGDVTYSSPSTAPKWKMTAPQTLEGTFLQP